MTVFRSVFDTRTDRVMEFETFEGFKELLRQLSEKEAYKPRKGEFSPKSSPLISPAVFSKGSTRKNAGVLEWGRWCCLDIDKYEGTAEDVIRLFSSYSSVVYSTASSTKETPKFRVVIELSENIPGKEIKHFWYALNKKFNSLGDPQTKDLCRMYYIPGRYPSSDNHFFIHHNGSSLEPRKLMDEFPFAEKPNGFSSQLPEEMQRRLLEYRKNSLNTKQRYSWSSWRDCPFVNKKLVADYRLISSQGWYHKMYQIAVSIASSAIRRGYGITPGEVANLCREIDNETGGWYKSRPLELEAERAITFALTNT